MKQLNVLFVHQLIAVDTLRLVQVKPDQLGHRLDAVRLGEENALENIRHVSQIEDVVELDGRRQEGRSHASLEGQRRIHQVRRVLLHGLREARIQILRQNIRVDGLERLVARKGHREHREVSLQPWIDGEAARRGIHARDILTVVDLLEREFGAVVPVMSKENIPYNLYVILVLVYVSFPFSFICI